MTIITECPTCNDQHMLEPNKMSGGWFPVRCHCRAIMWVQAARFDGMTYDAAGFRENVMLKLGKPEDEANVAEAEREAQQL